MNLSVTTTYDYKNVQSFNLGFILKNQRLRFIMLFVLDLFILVTNIINGVNQGLDAIDIGVIVGALVFNALLLGLYAYILTAGIKKSKFINQVETLTFTEEGISYSGEDVTGTNSGTLNYPAILKVEKYKHIYAIYIDRARAHLVSRTALAEKCSECEFESFLSGVLGADKLRFERVQ